MRLTKQLFNFTTRYGAAKIAADSCGLNSYYEDRERYSYNKQLLKRLEPIKDHFHQESCFDYIIWGASTHGTMAYEIMKTIFPNARVIAFVDNFKKGSLYGAPIIKPQEVKKHKFGYALITTHPGRTEALSILESMGKKIRKDFNYFMSKDIPEELLEC